MSIRLGTGLQVDLRIVPEESFGAALVYFTGSKQHNIVLRGMAKDRGLRINEYGVYKMGTGAKSAGTVTKSKAGAKGEKKKAKPAARKKKEAAE